MKTVKIIIVAVLAIVLGANSYASTPNSSKSEKLKVFGNCKSCKARIEKAAKVDGVSSADWNTESKILDLTYDPSKTNLDQIGKKVAAVGHDTEKFKADDKVYSALPGCCKYR